eukprot:m.947590 g.947590  ORF g.947590 m.947590 type:complete len:91 (-) comp23848_c0_seq65:1564-1836(-)
MWVVTSPTSNRTYLLSATRNWTSASDFCRFDNKRPSTASLQWEHETDAAFEPSELACDKNSKTLRYALLRLIHARSITQTQTASGDTVGS